MLKQYILFISLFAYYCGFSNSTDFYVVKGIDFQKISVYDKNILDSTLTLYHKEEKEIDKLEHLYNITENLVSSIWHLYNEETLDRVKKISRVKTLTDTQVKLVNRMWGGTLSNKIIYQKNIGHKQKEEILLDALKSRVMGKDVDGVIQTLHQLMVLKGSVYDFESAFKFFDEGVKKAEESNNYHSLVVYYSDIALFSKGIKSHDHYFSFNIHKAVQNAKKNTKLSHAGDYYVIAQLHILNKEYEKAIVYLKKCLRMYMKKGNYTQCINTHINIAELYLKKKKYKKALENIELSKYFIDTYKPNHYFVYKLITIKYNFLFKGFSNESVSYLNNFLSSEIASPTKSSLYALEEFNELYYKYVNNINLSFREKYLIYKRYLLPFQKHNYKLNNRLVPIISSRILHNNISTIKNTSTRSSVMKINPLNHKYQTLVGINQKLKSYALYVISILSLLLVALYLFFYK